jgi:hypothetical protein
MDIDEFLIFFILYGITFYFLFNKNSEYISFILLGIIHLGFMMTTFKKIYAWYDTIISKENSYLLFLLFGVVACFLLNFTAFFMIIIALLYLQNLFISIKGTTLELPIADRIKLTYFEYIYIFFVILFYLYYFASLSKPDLFKFDIYKSLFEFNIFYGFNILFLFIFIGLSLYQFSIGIEFSRLRLQMKLQETFVKEIGHDSINFPSDNILFGFSPKTNGTTSSVKTNDNFDSIHSNISKTTKPIQTTSSPTVAKTPEPTIKNYTFDQLKDVNISMLKQQAEEANAERLKKVNSFTFSPVTPTSSTPTSTTPRISAINITNAYPTSVTTVPGLDK